ncbi:hypothetical protein [Rhodospirillum sp. A1_3_36]|uniref:hypothetical protein n=1 Tax=Rhodospirillum sp. A1_3_36 TaxID=3391666 RepID=UPI0039A4C2D5
MDEAASTRASAAQEQGLTFPITGALIRALGGALIRAVGGTLIRVGCVIVGLSVPGASSALAADCPQPEMAPRVILETGFAQPTLDTSKTASQLAAILASQQGASAVGNAVGLTSTRPTYSYQTRVSAKQVGNQRYCVFLTDLTIRFQYESILVYVARQYRPSTCPYHVTLDHELRHVALYRQGYEAFLPRLSARAAEVARQVNPMKASSRATAKQVHLKRIQRELEPLFQAFFKEQRARNLEMDTPQAYGLERDKCLDW